MQAHLYRAIRPIWPGGRLLIQRKEELEKTQWLTRGEIEERQLEKLKTLIRYVYDNVPYYRRVYQALDIHPEDIKTFEDFRALPFLTREDIRNSPKDLITSAPSCPMIPNSTGGSTGVPIQFYHERAFGWWDPALELRGRGWYGVREGEKIAFVWGASCDMQDQRLADRIRAALLQERYLNAFDMCDHTMQAFAEMLVRWKPAMFRAYPSAVTLFAQYIKDHKIDGIHPKLIETTAEKVTDQQRKILEEVFRCKVADWYSSRELGTIGFECPQGSMHICETRYLEIVANNKPARTGELGEVVITSLHQFGMPFIRYKLGDMAIIDEEPCPCGRGLLRLREIVGRVSDFLVTGEGHFIHGGYFPHTFRRWPEISRYQVYQPDRHHLEVQLVLRDEVTEEWITAVRRQLLECFGSGMQIDVQIVDSIPLTKAGKHRFIISDVKLES